MTALLCSSPDGTALPRTSGSALPSGEPPGFRKDSAGSPGGRHSLEECSRPEPRIGTLGMKLLHSRIACLPGSGIQGKWREQSILRCWGVKRGKVWEAAKFPTKGLG